ncbi:type II toxin-antitoxin system VapC family toxin [Pontiellaceae bacterium B1224]|nr:type II toxin-antitoxin system VapC family toxin [Pontiellaceae bacterium B1224]
MIVVDTNVITGAFIDSDHAALVDKVMAKDQEWFSPYLWRSEFRNVLSLYCRHSVLEWGQALEISTKAEGRLSGRELWPVSARVLGLAQESGCSPYDCEFVSVAIDLGLPLITFDIKVLRQFPYIALSPQEFVER